MTHKQTIASLLCKKSNMSFIRFDEDFKIIEFDKDILEMADDKKSAEIHRDVRDAFWEFIGLEDELKALYTNKKIIQIPMIYKNDIYYNIELECCEISNEKSIIAYFTKKTEFLLSYTKIAQDINKQTLIFENNKKERRKKEQYNNLINQNLITFNVDVNGLITKINDACAYFFELEEKQMLDIHFSNFFKTRESNINKNKILSAVDINGKNIFFHIDIITSSKDGEIYENIIVCQDITYLKKIQEELTYAVEHDALTGLANRSNLLRKIDNAIGQSKKSNNSFAICFIDLNKFKPINDNYGHHAGDMLLKHISKLLLGLVRENDTVARIGGDEFVILFENIQSKDCIESTLSRIDEVSKTNPLIYNEDDTIHFSFSLGTSVFPDDGEDAKTLLEVADKEMYKIKNSGEK